jgi:hypothetical protein
MRKSHLLAAIIVTAISLPAFGRPGPVETRRASMRGGGDHGKCTIEVEVDDVAEVEVMGDIGRLITLSGYPARFVRMECNGPLPADPYDFRFRGIDGRGQVTLVQAPGRGRPAVVRINDYKGGREGYTFDLEWQGGGYGRGGGNGYWDGSYDRGGYDRGGYDRGGYDNGGYDNGGYDRGGNYDRGWDRELRYHGRGDGYFRDSDGRRDRVYNCDVSINPRGDVFVSFDTDRRYRLDLRGRVQRMDGNNLIAVVSGNGINGPLYLSVDNRNRVREVRLSSNRVELRWRD